MENKTPLPINSSYLLDAEISDVWQALTEKVYLKYWYYDIPTFIPVEGYEFTFSSHSEKNDFVHLCKILKVDAERLIQFSWRTVGYSGMSHITIELADERGSTRVLVTHDIIEDFPQQHPELNQEAYALMWQHLVDYHLRRFVERTLIQKSIDIHTDKERLWQIVTDCKASWTKSFGINSECVADFREHGLVVWKNTDGARVDYGRIIHIKPQAQYTVGFYDEKVVNPDVAQVGKYFEKISLHPKGDGITTLEVIAGPTRNTFYQHYESVWTTVLNNIKKEAEEIATA